MKPRLTAPASARPHRCRPFHPRPVRDRLGGPASEHPLIYTDDHGYGDVSMHGETDVRKPHIDRIAGKGMFFPAMDEDHVRNVAFVEHLDRGIGHVLDRLDDAGLT